MRFRIVCIARTIAAGGEAVGRAVSERLGFRYIDEEIVTKAAEKANVDARVVAAAEHKRPLVERLIESIGIAHTMADPSGMTLGLPLEAYYMAGTTPRPAVPEDYRDLIRETVKEIGAQGDAVIVAHAASMALAGVPDVLRVLVTASPVTRAQRLAEGGERDAAAAVTASDRQRREYFKSFYKIKEEQPTHYDLVVNTDVLSPEQAVRLIVAAAQGE